MVIGKFFGLLQKTTEASAAGMKKNSREGSSLHRGSKDFRRGTAAKASERVGRVAYRVVESTVVAESFLQKCQVQSHKWRVALRQEDSTLFLHTLQAITDVVTGHLDNDAERAHARGCCMRALIFVGVNDEGSLKNFGEASAKKLCSLVPEQPELFKDIAADSKLSMADMGLLFFWKAELGHVSACVCFNVARGGAERRVCGLSCAAGRQ